MPYGAPVSRLDDLIDVTGAGALEGDMLYFDAASGTFMVGRRANLAELLANTLILHDIGDVNIPAPANLDFIYWDDTAGRWVNISYANLLASIQGDTSLDDLAGVNVPAPADDDVLYWNNAASEWQSKAIAAAGYTEIASDVLRNSNDAEKTTDALVHTKIKEVLLNADLDACRIKFDLRSTGWAVWGRIYKNGVAIGIDQTRGGAGTTTFTEDFTGFVSGDLIQIYAKTTNAPNPVFVSNMRFYYDHAVASIGGHALQTTLPTTTDPTISMTNQDP